MPKEIKKNIKDDEKQDKVVILTKIERILCIAIAVFALVAPLIFTRSAWFFDVSFVDTGQIGDTIGGISAPFIGLVGAFLVYKSFEAQIKANYQQQINHNQQLRLIRKEQGLGAIAYLFEEVEKIIKKNEEKFNKGSIGHINKYLIEFKNAQMNKGVQEYENYIKRKEHFDGVQIGKAIEILYENTMHLRVLVNHITDYSLEFRNENNTTELTHFYTSKMYKLLKELRLYELNKEPIKSLESTIRLEDEFKLATFNNCRLNINHLLDKLEQLSFSSLI